jgi:3-hydroxybutyryl-CoA dehydrogenase
LDVETIGVIGCGLMGSGIVEACARSGLSVVVREVDQEALHSGLARLRGSLDKGLDRGKLSAEDHAAALDRVRGTTDLSDLGACDWVIEAAVEELGVKRSLFAELDALMPAHAVLSTNTSSISITKIAAATGRPDRVIGMHFFNPVPVMQLVELIRGLQTSDATYAIAETAARAIGKAPVRVRNSPGFVVNRMLCPMINEAIFALAEGLATAAEIDDAMKLGANHPIGPLALCDLIGLDVELAVMNVLFEGFKDPKYRPAPLLVEMVEAGYLGRKSGRGFFTYA